MGRVLQYLTLAEIMGEDESKEVFLSLEDDEVVAAQPQAQKIKKPKPVEEDLSYLEAEIVDNSVIEEVSGSFSVTWPLLGMDCPDCAAKAMGALNHMKQVDSPYVSATSGEIKVNIVLDYGPMSEVSSVLRSLGHAPNIEHYELVGVRAAAVAHRNGVPVPKLERVIKRQPGILDAEISDAARILVQLLCSC